MTFYKCRRVRQIRQRLVSIKKLPYVPYARKSLVSQAIEGRPPFKKSLLNEINECSFAVNDMLLYLDTHPCDEAALSYFMEHKNRRVAALKEYAKYYGPLTIDTADDEASESFLWVETPWPWEGGGC